MNENPAIDKDTRYHTAESFKNTEIARYISKSLASENKDPFGAFLMVLDRKYFGSSDEEKSAAAQKLKEIIDAVKVPAFAKPERIVSFDVKAREENQFYMLTRVAEDSDCDMLRKELYSELVVKGYNNVRIAAKSFNPAQQLQVTPHSVTKDLEKLLS